MRVSSPLADEVGWCGAIWDAVYQTALVSPGATNLVTARITIKLDDNLAPLVTIRSVADATNVDAVRVLVQARDVRLLNGDE